MIMEKTKNGVIPSYTVRKEVEELFRETFYTELRSLNESYKELQKMKDLEIPKDPKAINADSVNHYVDQRINDVLAASMLTFDGKERAKKEWEDIRQKAVGHIQKVRQFLEDYPDAEVSVKSETVICNNAESIIFENCKVETPAKVFQHYELICKVEAAIAELQDFERKNDYPTGDLVNIDIDIHMSKNPQLLIENWLHQDVRREYAQKHTHMFQAMEMQTRKERAMHQARLNELAEKYQQEHPEDYFQMPQRQDSEQNGTVKMM